jgi:hypothetical protein
MSFDDYNEYEIKQVRRFINNHNKRYGLDDEYEYDTDEEQFCNHKYDHRHEIDIKKSNYCGIINEDNSKIERLKELEELFEDHHFIKNECLLREYKNLCDNLNVKLYCLNELKLSGIVY